jgi:hypothetical protein
MKTEAEIIELLITEARAFHKPQAIMSNYCQTCDSTGGIDDPARWPCTTSRLADALESSEARAEAFQTQLHAEQSDNADLRARIEALQESGGDHGAG